MEGSGGIPAVWGTEKEETQLLPFGLQILGVLDLPRLGKEEKTQDRKEVCTLEIMPEPVRDLQRGTCYAGGS